MEASGSRTILHRVGTSRLVVTLSLVCLLVVGVVALRQAHDIRSLEAEQQALAERHAALQEIYRTANVPGVTRLGNVPTGHPTIVGPAEWDGCVVERLASGVCPNASTRSTPMPELRLADELSRAPFRTADADTRVEDLVAAALGWRNLERSSGARPGLEPRGPFGNGRLGRAHVHFDYPAVSVRYLSAVTSAASRGTAIVLHGHVSTPEKVLGLDADDYMRGIGRKLFDEGFDVVAIEKTHDPIASAYLNAQLNLFGVQIYGLWARSACEIAAEARRNGAPKVLLYGLSNGGLTAHFASILCDEFDLVIVDDILTDWRGTWRGHSSIYAGQNYGIYFLAPLFQQATFREVVTRVQNPTVFTRTRSMLDALLADIPHGPAVLTVEPRDGDRARVYFVEKRHVEHIAEVELVLDLLRGETIAAKRAL